MIEILTRTMELRFVERTEPVPGMGDKVGRKIRVLQQKFIKNDWSATPVWKDVPCIEEPIDG